MKFKELKAVINAIPDEFEETECYLKIDIEDYSLDSVLIQYNVSPDHLTGIKPSILFYGE